MTRTKMDIRQEIIELVHTNDTAYTPLSKRTQNSVVAYLTGELPIRPIRVYHSGVPTTAEVQEKIAQECGLSDWLSIYRTEDYCPGWRKDDLEAIKREMDERGDQREWVEGEPSSIQ